MTVREAARLQGYLAKGTKWEYRAASNFNMIGNTMSVSVLERPWTAIRNAQGFTDADMWQNGTRQEDLRREAAQDYLNPSHAKHVRDTAERATAPEMQTSDQDGREGRHQPPTDTIMQMLLRQLPKDGTDPPHPGTRSGRHQLPKPSKTTLKSKTAQAGTKTKKIPRS